MNDEILLIDKPAGMTSFGVVARVRRVLSEQAGMVTVKGKDGVSRQRRKKVKVGHTGCASAAWKVWRWTELRAS